MSMASDRAKKDSTWSERTLMIPDEFGDLLEMVVDTTNFQYNGVICEQLFGMAMVSLLSLVLVNLFMEEFEPKALDTAPHPPKFWGRYVHDKEVVNKQEYEDELFEHINQELPSIKFTIEREKRPPPTDIGRYHDRKR